MKATKATATLLLAIGACALGAAASDTTPAELRQFRVGMPLAALPAQGYVEFACTAAPDQKLKGWADYRTCAAGPAGLREVSFRYDDDGEHQTKVAGQPMLLSLLLTEDGTVDAIHMRTDPSARLFLHKRAYIFGEQVMARYGDLDWTCHPGTPSPGAEPVGGVFVNEHCEKTMGNRHLVVERALFLAKDKSLRQFTSQTDFLVSQVKPVGQ